jgi:hypothetical protein|nr:MAG TPA: hypothetical protein [Caudoviricetes sp.]
MAADYMLQHRPGNPKRYPDEVATIDNLSSGRYFPRDFLANARDYLPMSTGGAESLNVMRSVQGRPDAIVTVYRGAPVGELNTGDWVTLSREYAEIYAGDGAYSDNPNSRVFEYKARAGDLSFDGDSLSEVGYWGESQVYGGGVGKKADKKAAYDGRRKIGSNGG